MLVPHANYTYIAYFYYVSRKDVQLFNVICAVYHSSELKVTVVQMRTPIAKVNINIYTNVVFTGTTRKPAIYHYAFLVCRVVWRCSLRLSCSGYSPVDSEILYCSLVLMLTRD